MFLDKGSDVNLCPVCLASFQDPVILPCGHTLNRRCLQRIVDLSSIPRPSCPSCRATFDREEIFVPNKTLADVVHAKATAELFVIDIGAHHAQHLASTLLQRLFDERYVRVDGSSRSITFLFYRISSYPVSRIFVQTDRARVQFNGQWSQIEMSSLTCLKTSLEEAVLHLREQPVAVRKLCLLTDGYAMHSNTKAMESTGIDRCSLIHIESRNRRRSRQLADELCFHFEYAQASTLDEFVQHFLRTF